MGAILMGIDPVFFQAFTPNENDTLRPILVCGDRIWNAAFEDTEDGTRLSRSWEDIAPVFW